MRYEGDCLVFNLRIKSVHDTNAGLSILDQLANFIEILIADLGLHWAMLRPAHRAKLSLLIDIRWKGLIMILAGAIRIKT